MVFWGTSLPPLVVTWFVYDPYYKSRVIWKKANIDIWESQIEIVYYWSHWNKGSTFGLNWQTNDTRRPNYYFFSKGHLSSTRNLYFLKIYLAYKLFWTLITSNTWKLKYGTTSLCFLWCVHGSRLTSHGWLDVNNKTKSEALNWQSIFSLCF